MGTAHRAGAARHSYDLALLEPVGETAVVEGMVAACDTNIAAGQRIETDYTHRICRAVLLLLLLFLFLFLLQSPAR